MKKISLISIFAILFLASLLGEDFGSQWTVLKRVDVPLISGQHFLLTYARSGTNLTSCYLQYLTGKPIKFLFDERLFLAENRLNVPIDYSKPALYRTHFPKDLSQIDNRTNKLLYILRNCKECLFRHNHQRFTSPEVFLDQFKKDTPLIREYMDGLQIYDNWEPTMRLLIHYEDLLSDPLTTVQQILAFFDEPIPPYLTIELLKTISTQTLASYDKQHRNSGGSHSKGEDFLYHTRKLPLDLLREIDFYIQLNYPFLWNNYLNRYQS